MGTVKGVVRVSRVMFPKGVSKTNGGYTIASFEAVTTEEGAFEANPVYNTFSIKGIMPSIEVGGEYYVIAEEGDRHPQYGLSYEAVFMRTNIELDVEDEESVKTFLEVILTKRQVNSLFEAIGNPINALETKDIDSLTKAKGIGAKTAERIIEHYESQKDYSYAYIELGKFDIPPRTIRKVTDWLGSPELAVQKVKENPYELMSIDGYAFKKCDEIFLKLGGKPNDNLRIKSFLIYCLQEQANSGHTWCTPMSIIDSAVEFIPDANMANIGRILNDNPDVFYITEDKKRVSLLLYHRLEEMVSIELARIISAKSDFEYEGWKDDVAKIEEKQGWSFTEQQIEAMEMMLSNNVSILQGYGGTGKTTTLKAVVDILEKNGYVYAQTALSGKASANLTLVTGKEGKTIHRLLGFNPTEGGFEYNAKNPLPYDIIIIDEVSMVDAKLFGFLLKATRSGSKIIMLGDSEQLESIGIPIMKPMIDSGMIPTMTLTKIHRQAQMSAVVTDSIMIRKGVQVLGQETGRVVHGELRDLEYDLVPADDDIFVNVLKEFHKHVVVNKENVMDVQVLTQQRVKGKASCLAINKACQKIYNPEHDLREEVLIGSPDKPNSYILREGDKVINIKNNYDAEDEEGKRSPVFNGNIGIIEKFDIDVNGDKFMLVDFEGIGKVVIYEEDYHTIELAYCITVHKSQGSSNKVIIVALPFHYLLNTRQLLYTAITRTRKHCVVVATKKTVVSAINKDEVSKKRTYLSEYLNSRLTHQVPDVIII